MKHLDLFSGIGGFALAARWAGITTTAFCEIDPFCRKVLVKNFPGVPIHPDITTLDGNEYAGIDLITGGYPCHLWPEMRRVIAQAKPTWAICENVYGHIALGLDGVLHDLEALGYACQPFVIPALSTGADHNRERVFIVAYSPGDGLDESKAARSNGEANEHGAQRSQEDSRNEGRGSLRFGVDWRGNSIGRWGVEPPTLRVDDELPNRMDRNKSLGNAIDPMVAYELLRCITSNWLQRV